MQNKLIDLNNHLFAQLERLGNEDLKGETLKEEIERARAITGVSEQVISNGALALKAKLVMDHNVSDQFCLPKMLED